MKFIDEFRDRELARGLATAIAAEAHPGRTYRLMEFVAATPMPSSATASRT